MGFVLAVIVGGVAWLLLGNRLELDADPRQNEILNLGAYVLIAFPVLFLLILLWSP